MDKKKILAVLTCVFASMGLASADAINLTILTEWNWTQVTNFLTGGLDSLMTLMDYMPQLSIKLFIVIMFMVGLIVAMRFLMAFALLPERLFTDVLDALISNMAPRKGKR